MIVNITSVKIFRTICFFLIMLIVNGCYSHFAIDENTAKNVLKQKGISKVMLKDETEINFIDKENYLVSADWDNLTYRDINGNEHKVLFNDVMKWYDYNFDLGKTFMASMAFMLCLFVIGLLFFTVVIPFNPGG